jgi:hypothetical protein
MQVELGRLLRISQHRQQGLILRSYAFCTSLRGHQALL